MDFDWKDLDKTANYRVTVVRAPLAKLLEIADDESWDNWEDDWPGCREWLSRPILPSELVSVLDTVLNYLVTMDDDTVYLLLDILEGKDFVASGEGVGLLRGSFPMALEPDGDGALRLLAPDVFVDGWPHSPRAAALRGTFGRLQTVQRCMEAFVNLYGAIRLDDALGILRDWGLWDDDMESCWRDVVARRITTCGMFRTMLSDGVLYMGMALGPGLRPRMGQRLAKTLLRETDDEPRWLPPTADAFLEWADPDHFEDTPAAAAVMSYGLSLAPHLADGVRRRVAAAAADIRANVSTLEPELPSIFGDADDAPPPETDFPFGADFFGLPDLGFGDEGLDESLRWQFAEEQRRWLFKGFTFSEFRGWLLSPEGQAWNASKLAHRPHTPRGSNFQKPKKKKKGSRHRHR